MTRTITAAANTAAQAEVVRPALFAELDFSSGFVRVNSTPYTLVNESNNYDGIGHLGRIETGGEGVGVEARNIKLSVSGVQSADLATALNEHYQGRSCKVWLGLLDSSHQLIPDPILLFSGFMDYMDIVDDDDAHAITVVAESELAEWDRPRLSLYTNEEQQRLYPGDTGLSHIHEIPTFELLWGR